MVLEIVIALAVLCALAPAVLFVMNLQRYAAPRFGKSDDVRLAVLIPARDEERGIRACVENVLASREVDLEVWVLDDDSADRTADIVLEMAAVDRRVRLVMSTHLPRGWNGKQHACWELAKATSAPLLLFMDADVRLDEWALARCIAGQRSLKVSLLSGFPRQITVGFMEQMLLPLIHFVLLGFLPLGRMRKGTDPAYAAGCGQLMLVEREAYFASGGHAAIRETRHDGLRLPRLFREHGYRTDIVDLTNLASVRMYETPSAVWVGLAKNATEGMAAPRRIVPFTLLLGLGQIAPAILVVLTLILAVSLITHHGTIGTTMGVTDPFIAVLLVFASLLALMVSYLPRLLAVPRFKQPLRSAWLHPLGVTILLAVQWYALARQVVGRPVGWRARRYSTETGSEAL